MYSLRTECIIIVLITGMITLLLPAGSHSCWGYSPDIVNHRALAGLWKLTQRSASAAATSTTFPIKEFTVYPKKAKRPTTNEDQHKDILLMLKEDGSFQQYSSSSNPEIRRPESVKFVHTQNKDDADEDAAADAAARILDRYSEFGKFNGNWNFVGGKLILAADRTERDKNKNTKNQSQQQEIDDDSDDGYDNEDVVGVAADTILEGEVVATSEAGLVDNPVLREDQKQNDDLQHTNEDDIVLDTHLSVPKGQVKIGKFFYPKHHPSFFDLPIYNPQLVTGSTFELHQVLGALNTQQQQQGEKDSAPEYHESDFYNKTFVLTSQPLPQHKPKQGRGQHWSIKYNKFVDNLPPKTASNNDEDKLLLDQPVYNIRVVEMKFFPNNTFATVGGLGDATILRGKFSIIGTDHNHLWMQIKRFGFGRSVSGSVFSEGRSLAKDDEKAYWGKISYYNNTASNDDDGDCCDGNENTNQEQEPPQNQYEDSTVNENHDNDQQQRRRLVVNGSVLLGYGLEPLPVGLFTLTESVTTASDSSSTSSSSDSLLFDDDDDDDDDDSDDDDDDTIDDDFYNLNIENRIDDDADDDFFDLANAFQ